MLIWFWPKKIRIWLENPDRDPTRKITLIFSPNIQWSSLIDLIEILNRTRIQIQLLKNRIRPKNFDTDSQPWLCVCLWQNYLSMTITSTKGVLASLSPSMCVCASLSLAFSFSPSPSLFIYTGWIKKGGLAAFWPILYFSTELNAKRLKIA